MSERSGRNLRAALVGVGAVVSAVAAYDLTQRKHAILRNFPVIGHLRYALEAIGPELRQYIVTDNNDERPFSRDQRRWVYATAKRENPYFGFGTDNDIEGADHYLIIKHATFPYRPNQVTPAPLTRIPSLKVLGESRGRRLAFRPDSVVNISAMSLGSLSTAAVSALNGGARIAECLQNTGEGGIDECHRHGGNLIWQIGTGYFGCRTPDGAFDLERVASTCDKHRVRAIEVKLSQGAKPGLGGLLPAAKVTEHIAAVRGVASGVDCISPSSHSAFDDVETLIDFVETIAETTGLPVGIKSAVGEERFWVDLADAMDRRGQGPDFITIDGGEGGTGAAPLAWSDHVALPFLNAFPRVYRVFAERGLHRDITWIGSGKLGFPQSAILAMALGCDLINVGREAMMAVGCIQAQRCHTGHCPTGVATQSPWLSRGLDPYDKSVRAAYYIDGLRHDLLRLAHSCGVEHPGHISTDQIEFTQNQVTSVTAREAFGYDSTWD